MRGSIATVAAACTDARPAPPAPPETRLGPSPLTPPPGPHPPKVVSRSSDRKAVIYTIRIQTPPTATRLVPEEKAALKKLTDSCCDVQKALKSGASDVHICAAA
jgi:hypothetical protein